MECSAHHSSGFAGSRVLVCLNMLAWTAYLSKFCEALTWPGMTWRAPLDNYGVAVDILFNTCNAFWRLGSVGHPHQ
jgi:hypothetical protein